MRMIQNRAIDFGVIQQALDQIVTAGQFEWLDRRFQPFVQSRYHTFHTAAEEPTHRRKQKMRGKGHACKNNNQKKEPKRNRNRICHVGTLAVPEKPDKSLKDGTAFPKIPPKGELRLAWEQPKLIWTPLLCGKKPQLAAMQRIDTATFFRISTITRNFVAEPIHVDKGAL